MSTSRRRRHVGREKEDKKGKQDSVSSIVSLLPPSLRRRRDVTRVKVWLTTELTIDVTGEVRILRPST